MWINGDCLFLHLNSLPLTSFLSPLDHIILLCGGLGLEHRVLHIIELCDGKVRGKIRVFISGVTIKNSKSNYYRNVIPLINPLFFLFSI